MKKTSMHTNRTSQGGVSLIVTLLITVLLSLLALYGAGILVQDTRSAANDFRARQALTAAESGVEQGYSLMMANKKFIKSIGLNFNPEADNDATDTNESEWEECTAGDAQCQPIRSTDRTNWQYLTINSALVNAPAEGTFDLFLLTPKTGDSSRLVYNIVAIGKSADTTSTAVVKQGVYFFPLLHGDIGAPVAAAGNIPLGGNFSIVTNANGGGSGQALSAWTNDTSTIASTGSTSRCHMGERLSGGGCPSTSSLAEGPGACDDDLCRDPNFPADLFKFLFGVPKDQFQKIKDKATVLADCSTLGTTSSGLIWVEGDCNPSGDVGTATDPVTLVVEGDMTLNAGDQFYGFLYLFKYPTPTTAPKLIANGNATIHGAVFANDNIDLQLTGGFVLKYDSAVLGNLKKGTSGRTLGRIAGSWSDVQ